MAEEEHYGYFYGEEEKGLLDPAWERQQKKVSNNLSLDQPSIRVLIYLDELLLCYTVFTKQAWYIYGVLYI